MLHSPTRRGSSTFGAACLLSLPEMSSPCSWRQLALHAFHPATCPASASAQPSRAHTVLDAWWWGRRGGLESRRVQQPVLLPGRAVLRRSTSGRRVAWNVPLPLLPGLAPQPLKLSPRVSVASLWDGMVTLCWHGSLIHYSFLLSFPKPVGSSPVPSSPRRLPHFSSAFHLVATQC